MNEVHDPYGGCEVTCSHDLARGASAKELRDSDGPYPAAQLADKNEGAPENTPTPP